jgi:ABC-2 type transport system permease protein
VVSLVHAEAGGAVMRLVRAEIRKLLGLRTAWIGLLLGPLVAPALVLLNAPAVRREIAAGTLADTSDVGLLYLGVGLIGAMALGVVAVSSEYTSTGEDTPGARQLTATLLAVPQRLRLFTAKALALVLVVALQATVTAAATLVLTAMVYGDDVPVPAPGRVVGAILYWVLTALLAYAMTVVFRTGIVPLALLIVNSTVVSVSYLLTKVTMLAAYLPDIVGARMFIHGGDFPVDLSPVVAGLVMTGWVAALLVVAALLFRRRDA